MADRSTFLSPPHLMRLSWACEPIREAFGRPPYLVGSVLVRPDFRDIDVRLILDDDDFFRMFCQRDDSLRRLRFINTVISQMLETASGLSPIDFGIQPESHANTHIGPRNPLGGLRSGGVDVPTALANRAEAEAGGPNDG